MAKMSASERATEKQPSQKGSCQLTEAHTLRIPVCQAYTLARKPTGCHCQGLDLEFWSSSWQADEAPGTVTPPSRDFELDDTDLVAAEESGPRSHMPRLRVVLDLCPSQSCLLLTFLAI